MSEREFNSVFVLFGVKKSELHFEGMYIQQLHPRENNFHCRYRIFGSQSKTKYNFPTLNYAGNQRETKQFLWKNGNFDM